MASKDPQKDQGGLGVLFCTVNDLEAMLGVVLEILHHFMIEIAGEFRDVLFDIAD